MEQFPILNDNQVAILRADVNTGHIVDESYQLMLSDKQIAYTIFENYETALDFIKKELKTNNNIEFIIYGRDKVLIKYIRP